jgi:hypothetical protein
LEEALFKRDEEEKKRDVQESNEALRKKNEDDRLARSEAFADAVSEKVAAATEHLRRVMEETQRQKDYDRAVKKQKKEKKRRLKEQLEEQSKKNDDMAAQRVKDLEEELRDKHNLDKLALQNDLYREKLALDAATKRAADEADLALEQKRLQLAQETLKLKKQEYDVEQKQIFDRDMLMKSVQLAHTVKEVSLAERSSMIDENRKAADHQRKKENQRM